MPPIRNSKVHSHWHVVEPHSDSKKVREFCVYVNISRSNGDAITVLKHLSQTQLVKKVIWGNVMPIKRLLGGESDIEENENDEDEDEDEDDEF